MNEAFGGVPAKELGKYLGEWVVVCDRKVVAHGKDLLKLRKHIDACKGTPTVGLVPGPHVWIF